MTPEEYTEKLKTLALAYEQGLESIFVPAASELLGGIKNRIVNDGKDSNNSNIGAYSAKPAYFGVGAFVKPSAFTPSGKNGQDTFKNGRPHKTEFFPSGYKGLREKNGRRTDVMNFSYTGDTLLAYQLSTEGSTIFLGMVTEEASKRRKGLERMKGKRVFYATDEEIKTYNKNIMAADADFIKRTFQ